MRLISFAFEILPLVALFIGNSLYDIFIGAISAVIAALILNIYVYITEKRLSSFALFSVLISAVFTAASVLAGDSLFIKIQQSLFNGIFALMLLGGWVRGKAMMKVFFAAQFHLDDKTWRLLSLRWGLFMAGLVLANEWAWRSLSDDGWVYFKIFAVAPATGLFMLAQLPATLRGRIKEEK